MLRGLGSRVGHRFCRLRDNAVWLRGGLAVLSLVNFGVATQVAFAQKTLRAALVCADMLAHSLQRRAFEMRQLVHLECLLGAKLLVALSAREIALVQVNSHVFGQVAFLRKSRLAFAKGTRERTLFVVYPTLKVRKKHKT